MTQHLPLRPRQRGGKLLVGEPRTASGFVEGAAEQA
jgi:hypothetical protein